MLQKLFSMHLCKIPGDAYLKFKNNKKKWNIPYVTYVEERSQGWPANFAHNIRLMKN